MTQQDPFKLFNDPKAEQIFLDFTMRPHPSDKSSYRDMAQYFNLGYSTVNWPSDPTPAQVKARKVADTAIIKSFVLQWRKIQLGLRAEELERQLLPLYRAMKTLMENMKAISSEGSEAQAEAFRRARELDALLGLRKQ